MKFVWAMIARNFAVECRSFRISFLRMVLQPAIYLFVFGYVVGRMLSAGNGGNYAAVMAPGIVAITLMSAPYLVVGSSILTGFYFRTMEAWLLSPVKLRAVLLALVASGTIYGVVSAAVVAVLIWLILGIVPQHLALTAFFCVAGSMFFSLLAVTVLLTPVTPKKGQDVFSFLMMPMTFFGCTFYSFDMLQPPFSYLALLLPTTYLSEGLRAAYLPGSGSLPGSWIAAGLAAAMLLLIPLADWVLARRLRNFTW
jgi:ABC-2 type transport system permease protein